MGADRIGQTIGNHRVLALIGQGGMGAVYSAEHTVLGRKAAIKVLLPELSHNPELVQRFFVEARATAQLRHPSFVEVFDSGTLPDGSAYLVMEQLAGETLGECLTRRQRLPVAEALALAREIATGVGHAHQHGIVHRDLKPDNVFLTEGPPGQGPRVKVLDFGIAKLTATPVGTGSRTRTGTILGTPLFMAPEQCRGAGSVSLDQRVDIYALGCILHLMLGGEPPFPLEGFGEIIAAHLSTPPPPLRARDATIPAPVEALVLRMLAKRPEDRPSTMEAVIAELGKLPTAAATMVLGEAPRLPRTEKLPVARASTGGLSTFAGAASVIEESMEAPARQRRGWWLGGGGVAIAVAIGVALTSGRGERPRPAPAAAPVVIPKPPPEAPRPAPPPPEPEKPPATVVLTIDSTPAGAEVVDSQGTFLGNTPFEGRFPAGGGTAQLSLQKDGFRPKRLTLSLGRDQRLSVTLDRRAAAAPRPRPATPPTPTKPVPEDNDRRKL
jgi:tRNA A-37 threonylcarbamoyl transferase component Bud32